MWSKGITRHFDSLSEFLIDRVPKSHANFSDFGYLTIFELTT